MKAKKAAFLVAAILVVAVAASIFVSQMVRSGEETSDQIPDSIVAGETAEFFIAVGSPGARVEVVTDKGRLSVDPDKIVTEETVGKIKSMPDSVPDDPKKQSYIVDNEGRVSFKLRTEEADAESEVTITLKRDGEGIRTIHVRIVTPVSKVSIDTRIASGDLVYVEKDEYVQDGEAGVNVTLSLRDQAGEEIDLSQGEYFANVTLLTENGTRLLEIGPTDNGMETSYPISRPLFIVPVLEPKYPFTISVSIEGDMENILLQKTFNIER